MLKIKEIDILSIILIPVLVFYSCTKKNEVLLYDLFPLELGNEFSYIYESKLTWSVEEYIISLGNEFWKVVSETDEDTSIMYIIERRLKGTEITHRRYNFNSGNLNPVEVDTLLLDQIRYLNVNQSKSTSIVTLADYSLRFERYQPVAEIIVTGYPDCIFKADSGLTRMHFYYRGNHTFVSSLILDNVKLHY